MNGKKPLRTLAERVNGRDEMNSDFKLPKRRSIRLKGYDYSQNGAYFVTACTKDRQPTINSEIIREIIRKTWENLPNYYPNVLLDEFVIMPNHIHGIIVIQNNPVGAGLRPARKLSEIVRAFKSYSSREINRHFNSPGRSFWQRNYYDHIIRNEIDLSEKRKYICENPLKWGIDEYNPANLHHKKP